MVLINTENIDQDKIVLFLKNANLILTKYFNKPSINPPVVLHRRQNSAYESEFFHSENKIYLDIPKLLERNDIYIVHTLGEELGHNYHYNINPLLFENSDPSKKQILEAIKKGMYEELANKVLQTSNLIEFVGFSSGLFVLTEMYNLGTARDFVNIGLEEFADYIPENLPFLEEIAEANNKQVEQAYASNPKNIEKQVLKGKQEPQIEETMNNLKHGYGYYLACKNYQLSYSDRVNNFKAALNLETISQLYTKIFDFFV